MREKGPGDEGEKALSKWLLTLPASSLGRQVGAIRFDQEAILGNHRRNGSQVVGVFVGDWAGKAQVA